MSRFVAKYLVPLILGVAMSGLAVTLIGVVIARSPYTHGNLSAAGYDRTGIIYVGQEQSFEGIPLADPGLANTGDPVQDGAALFFRYGCASCHGLNGEGGAVGKDLQGDSALKISTKVRDGPKTMPAFGTEVLPESDLQKLIAFLQSVGK